VRNIDFLRNTTVQMMGEEPYLNAGNPRKLAKRKTRRKKKRLLL